MLNKMYFEETNDIIEHEINIVLYDKDGNVIKIETPKPECRESWA